MPRLLLAALLASLTLGTASAHAQQASAGGAAVDFSKAFETPTIGPGSVTTLTFTITNDQLGTPVEDLAFTDTLPAGVTIADPARATTTCPSSAGGLTATLSAPGGGGTITFSEGGLGASSSCTVSVDVTSATPGEHTNTSGPLTGSFGTGGTASAVLMVDTSLPGFSKSFAPATVVQGGRSTLTLTIDNTANASNVDNLDFTDALPVGMVIATPANASTTCGTALIPPTLTATAGSSTVNLDANGVGSFPALEDGAACTVTVDVLATAIGELVNASGSLQANFVDAGFASAVLTSTSGGALSLTKAFVTNPVAPGANTTLRFTLRNNSRTEAATAVSFTDDLNSALSFLAATGTPLSDVCGAGSTLSGTFLLTLSGGALAPEETCVFDVTLQVPADATPGTYVNTTSGVSGTVGGEAMAGAAASASLFVAFVPTLTKEFTDDPVTAGGDVTLEFTITNSDPTGSVSDLGFLDDLSAFLPTPLVTDIPRESITFPPFVIVPGGREDVCGSGSLLNYAPAGVSGEGIQLTDGTLAAGASCTFSVVITIPDDFPNGTYTNTTSEITGTVGGETVIGPAASDELVVVAGPQLLKAFLPASVRPGTSTALQFTLSLDGNASGDATGIGFTDDLTGVIPGLAPTAGQLPLAACGGTLTLGMGGFGGSPPLVFSGGTLAPGEDCAFEVSLDVPASAPYGTVTNTTSTVSAAVGGLPLTSPAASADLTVTPFRFEKHFVNMRQPTPTLIYGIENVDPAEAAASLTFSDPLGVAIPGVTFGTLPSDPCGAGSSLFADASSTLTLVGGTVPAGTFCVFHVPLVLPPGLDPGLHSSTSGDLSGQLGGTGHTAPGATSSFTLPSRLPLFSKAFEPSTIFAGGVSRLTFTIDNTAHAAAATSFGFVDNFPTGVVIADPTNASTTCAGGMGDATAGATSFSFSGGSVAARELCTVSIDVTAAAVGEYLNTTGDLSSSAGNSGPATATLTVIDPAVYVTKAVTFTTDGDSDGKADAGDVLHYTVTVTNRTPETLPDVTFRDTPGANSTLVGGSVSAIPGTVTSGDQPTDTEVAVSLGSLAGMASATIVFDVAVDDPLPESVAAVCNQGTARGDFGTVVTDDPATSAFNDATCVAAERPVLDVVITSHTGAARGESLQVFATAENTTAGPFHYKRRLFLTRPDGHRTSFPAARAVLGAGQTTAASLVTPAIPIAADAPAGTYIVEVVGALVNPPVIVDTERFEFTLGPLVNSISELDLSTVRPGAGPNPFMRRTTLRFPVLEATAVDLRVFDAAGREVAVLVEGQLPRGLHEAEFDGTSRPAGVYFWRLTVDGDVTTGAVTLVR